MELKTEVIIEHQKEDRIYRMSMPANAPLGEAYEAAGLFLEEMVRMINEQAEKLRLGEEEVPKKKKKKK